MLRDTSYFRRSIVRQILGLVLFVFSIAATISLETWVKIFSNIFGYSIVTTIQVLIVFLFGSALGAFYFWKKDR